jgi:hypothetical protein
MGAMSEQQDEPTAKSPVEQAVEHAVEVFVYAPIGLLFEGASIVPQLVEKGKAQVTMAKMLGQFAVGQGRTEAEKTAQKLGAQALGLLARLGQSPNGHDPIGPKPGDAPAQPPAATPAPEVVPDEADAATPATGTSTSTEADDPVPAPATERIDPATLAIPDYDGLSASHVVNRLGGLSAGELEAVRRYEAANRGRKTILSKVAQLQAG